MQIRKFFSLAAVFATTLTAVAQTATLNNPVKSAAPSAKEIAAIIALEQRDVAAAKVNDVETLVSLWTEDGVLLEPRSEPVTGIGHPAVAGTAETSERRDRNPCLSGELAGKARSGR